MCECELFTSEDSRAKIINEIKSFRQEEFIYAALPYGGWTMLPDPQRMIVENIEHANKQRLTSFKTNSSLHSKYLIGRDKIIWGSGNMTESSILDKHETYEVVHKDCHPEKYQRLFSEFKRLWSRSSAPSEVHV